MASDLKRVGGAWVKQGARGEFWSISINEPVPADSRLLAFHNDRKKSDTDPSIVLYLASSDGSRTQAQTRQQRVNGGKHSAAPQSHSPAPAMAPAPPTEDSIPF